MIGKKILATTMSAVLAVSLSPGLALASTLEAGQAATGKVLTPQAKKSVYVLDTVSYTYSGSSYTYVEVGDGNGDYNYDEEEHDYVYVGEGKGAYSYQSQPYTETTVTSYKYNSGGLLTKVTEKETRDGANPYSSNATRATLKYKGKNMTKLTSYGSTYKVKSKNGHIQSVSRNNTYSGGYDKYSTTYTWNGDKCTKVTSKNTWKYSGEKKRTSTSTTKYSNFKKGVPTKSQSSHKSSDGSSSTNAPYKYTLDSKGNVKKAKYSSYSSTSYKLSYKSGRVVKKARSGSSTAYTMTYKKVSVSNPSITKAQQWSLINGNTNCAFPVSLGVGN